MGSFACHCGNTGWNGHWIRVGTELNLEKKISCCSSRDPNLQPFDHKFSVLRTSCPGFWTLRGEQLLCSAARFLQQWADHKFSGERSNESKFWFFKTGGKGKLKVENETPGGYKRNVVWKKKKILPVFLLSCVGKNRIREWISLMFWKKKEVCLLIFCAIS